MRNILRAQRRKWQFGCSSYVCTMFPCECLCVCVSSLTCVATIHDHQPTEGGEGGEEARGPSPDPILLHCDVNCIFHSFAAGQQVFAYLAEKRRTSTLKHTHTQTHRNRHGRCEPVHAIGPASSDVGCNAKVRQLQRRTRSCSSTYSTFSCISPTRSVGFCFEENATDGV